jgi:hypothetical protein
MKRGALEKMNRQASEMPVQGTPGHAAITHSCNSSCTVGAENSDVDLE